MGTKTPYILLALYCLICIVIGWTVRGIIDKVEPMHKAMAWGYDEKENVWNRIRVDDRGYVICNKKE